MDLTMGTPTFIKLKYVESYLRFQYLDIYTKLRKSDLFCWFLET
jgi:hypothetical protein